MNVTVPLRIVVCRAPIPKKRAFLWTWRAVDAHTDEVLCESPIWRKSPEEVMQAVFGIFPAAALSVDDTWPDERPSA